MSDSATFELMTHKCQREIEIRASQHWRGLGYEVNVFVHPDTQDSTFCILEYVFGYPEEELMMREVVGYLLGISLDHEIYYYRCSDFIGLVNDDAPVIELTLDDLFCEEFAPSIGASLMRRYLIRSKFST